jgi:hypothetical protein
MHAYNKLQKSFHFVDYKNLLFSFSLIFYLLNANFYIMDMKQIPLLGDTTNIYNTVLYKSGKKNVLLFKFCCLYEEKDDGNGHFNAHDSSNGKLLWQGSNDFGVNAPPITYQVDGEQYIAVAAGGSSIFGYKQGDHLLVYKLNH